ncbi:MAG: hypothetical protein IJG97_01420 [Bacilli bacterium]|nr:hypothetical protein [Bacilli bacterium]
MKKSRLIISIISILVFMGALTLFTSSPEISDNDKTKDIKYKETVSFGEIFTLPKDKTVTVGDELEVKLLSVGDSRCKEGMQCIWKGELTYKIEISNIENTDYVELGTVNKKEETYKEYIISLDDYNDSTEYAKLKITKN